MSMPAGPASPAPSGYGKPVAAVLAGSGCAVLIEVVDMILAAHGQPPLKASLVSELSTFITTAAVLFAPHNMIGGG